MTNKVLLNNIDHGDLRYAPRHGADHGDSANQMLLLPTEWEEAQREFPILFRRDEEGRLQAVALLGLDRAENLFLGPDGWTSRYVPAVQARGPFSIVTHRKGDEGGEPMIHVDLDDTRIGRDVGEPLFLPNGGNAPMLARVAFTLGLLHDGFELAADLYAALDELQLVEPAEISVTVGENIVYDLPGFGTISEERLAALTPEDLAALNGQGFLRLAILASASLGNFSRLIEAKNRKLAGG